MLQESGRRHTAVRLHLRKDQPDNQSFSKREAGGYVKEGNQEAAEIQRPNQNMGCWRRDQGQEAAVGAAEADRICMTELPSTMTKAN
jgi:hypothetical protein